jgi:hypothetical protein
MVPIGLDPPSIATIGEGPDEKNWKKSFKHSAFGDVSVDEFVPCFCCQFQ